MFQCSQTSVPILKAVASLSPVVIVGVLLMLAGLGFLLHRYLCHKGAYRTIGEPSPVEDPDQAHGEIVTDEKEYFI
uniref:Uncharacterized protein n=1 Tax=Oncorhynchus kisutch TaxID=8019 RepID=A0A8C7IC97_ONCKI